MRQTDNLREERLERMREVRRRNSKVSHVFGATVFLRNETAVGMRGPGNLGSQEHSLRHQTQKSLSK